MKRILPALVAVSLLWAPATVAAKEFTSATVCGASGCNDSTHPSAFLPALEGGPPGGGAAPRAHPFYRLRVVVGEGGADESMKLLAVPHGNYVRGPDGAWRQVSTDVLGQITALAEGLRPFPASQLVRKAPPLSHPGAPPASSTPRPIAQRESPPWPVFGALAAAVILATGLGIGLRRAWSRRLGSA